MRKRISNTLLGALLCSIPLMGCEPELNKYEGTKILSEEDFIQLMCSVHFSESMLAELHPSQDYRDAWLEIQYDSLFTQYGLTNKRDFELNRRYYSEDPKAFLKLYEKIHQQLLEKEMEYRKVLNTGEQSEKKKE